MNLYIYGNVYYIYFHLLYDQMPHMIFALSNILILRTAYTFN